MAVVTAVSLAVPRTIDIRGRPVFTSIVRDPYPGALTFGAGGPLGNRTAVHTEHVLATITENYDYWTAQLGIPRQAWPPAFWGENITISGLREDSLRVGDLLKVGKAAVFQVTSPRIPCFKLSWRLGQPDEFLKTLVASGLTGFYLRVVIPGDVAAGDDVLVESPAAPGITVSELSKLLSGGSTDIILLKRTLATPGLGDQASSMLRHRVTQLTDGVRCQQGRWQGWRSFRVEKIIAETADVRSVVLRPVDGGALAQFRAGQYLTVRLLMGDSPAAVRTWSISEYQEDGPTYRISVRRIPDGQGSSYLHVAQVGDLLDVKAPAGRFVLDRSTVYRVVLISAGIGVTPLAAMLRAHAAREDASPLLWIHTTRHGGTHALRSEVDDILASNPLFRRHVVYTQPRESDRPGVDFDAGGRLRGEDYGEILGATYQCRPFGRDIELPSQAGAFYICGPAAFQRTVRDALVQFGVAEESIYSENFQANAAPAMPVVESAWVHFKQSRKSLRWESAMDVSLLELAEQAGLNPESGCRVGNCHTCAVPLMSGTVCYRAEPPEPPPGMVLMCCARPGSESVEIDL